jgi:hypothetical protein
VSITIANLSLLGAQAGRDARVDRDDSSKESIVDAAGQTGGPGGGAAFYATAANVVIDGFTIQGGTGGLNGSGIYVAPGLFYPGILNNIIQNNAVGVYTTGLVVLVKHNLFKTNNAGAAGSSEIDFAGMAGFGIAVHGESTATAIIENAFEGNLAAAMVLDGGEIMEVNKNSSKNDGSFVVFIGGGISFISHNQGEDFGAKGFLPIPRTSPPGGYADAAIDVGIGSEGLQINDNDLEKGKAAGYNGIAFSTIFGVSSPSAFNQVSNNSIKRFAGNGIVAGASSGMGMLAQSAISGNDIEDNGNDGILIQAATMYNSSITLLHNEAEGNHTNDCEDDTIGSSFSTPITGTLGTANTWFDNSGNLSLPSGLCTPSSGHHHD